MWMIEHFLLIRQLARRPPLRAPPRNTTAALVASNSKTPDVTTCLHDVSLVPQAWEYDLDAIELPVSTTESAMRTWLQTNEENIDAHAILDQFKKSEGKSSLQNPVDETPESQLRLNVSVSRVALMFNIAITSMEIWQRSQGTGYEYVLVHLAWYPKGRYCATSAGNTPMHLSTSICLERYPGTPGFVPYSARKTGDHHIDFPAMRAGTTDTCSAAIEGEGNCLVRVQFVGDFLPSFIDLVSATWVLYKMAYAYDLLKYPSFWYADGLMDLMMTLEGVKCEAEVVKGNERVYRNLQKGLQEDIRKNGFRSEQTDEEQEKSSGGVWAVGEWLWTWLEAMFSSESGDTIDIPFPIDKRSDAVALKDARKSIEHQATLICGILEGDVDRRTGRIHYHPAGPFRSWNREILQRNVPPDPAPESDHLGEVD